MRAIVALEDGSYYIGKAFGSYTDARGEIVFNTSMSGYQEILTDPSYKGQVVLMTYPLIGNYGVNDEDLESRRPWVEGFIVKELARHYSNYRAKEGLSEFLNRNGIPGVEGVDTRAITRNIREKGSLRVYITTKDISPQRAVEIAREIPDIKGRDLVREVTTEEPYLFRQGMWNGRGYEKPSQWRFRIVVYDFGVKRNILRIMNSLGIETYVVPADTPYTDVLAMKPDGVFLSNGPGDPEPVFYAIENVRNLIGKLPIFGICLGHQILSLAIGGKSFKMKFGHRGANHPVKNLDNGRVEITAQNHSFAIDVKSMEGLAEITHVNLNDGTLEGIRDRKRFFFTVQYHPEDSPGPHDSTYLFKEFLELLRDFDRNKSKHI